MRKAPPDPTLEAVAEAIEVLQLYQRLQKQLGLGEGDALDLAITGHELEECQELLDKGCPPELLAPILS